jgi:hypothetical protein
MKNNIIFNILTILFITFFHPMHSAQAQEKVDLTALDPDRVQWSVTVAEIVNKFFSQPYADAHLTRAFLSLECPNGTLVNRPNHSLAHGMRQSYLAVDLAIALENSIIDALSPAGKDLATWIKRKHAHDKDFFKKLEFANAFQRVGRESEISRSQNPTVYENYLKMDQQYFSAQAQEFIGEDKLFKDQAEVDLYKRAIVNKYGPGAPESDELYLSKLFYTAHQLDLRRLPAFSEEKILGEVSMQLFETDKPNKFEREIIAKVWNRSGAYLNATGDRDLVTKKQWFNTEVFCAQAKDPKMMVIALQTARTEPERTLVKSIVSHARAMGQIKTGITAAPTDTKETAQLREQLRNAPYTASEAYLKIILGSEYQEISPKASKDEARRVITNNIKLFLAQPKKNIAPPRAMTPIFVPRIDNADDEYVNTLVNCLMQERENREKIVLYHTTEPELAFLYDVYTDLRRQLMIQGKSQTATLRAVDTAFLRLDETVAAKNADGTKIKANVHDFMEEFKTTDDKNTIYQEMGLSTNFALFGSDQKKNSDTYGMFYHVKDESVTLKPPSFERFLDYVEEKTGIKSNAQAYRKILNQYILTCNDKPCRNGRLIQLFVDPAILDDVTYFSVLLGYPVLINDKNPSLKEPIELLRTAPNNFNTYLLNTKSKAPYLPGPLQLADLQVRLFMRPEVMMNENLVKVLNHWRFSPSAEQIKSYEKEIKAVVDNSLADWLLAGAPAESDAFTKETIKLPDLVSRVFEGSFTTPAPKAPTRSLEAQFVNLLDGKRSEQAATFLATHYRELADKQFLLPADQHQKNSEPKNLVALMLHYNLMPVYKVAFAKGILPGGTPAYEVLSKMNSASSNYPLIQGLLKYSDPQKSSELFLKYFGEFTLERDTVEFMEAINEIGNDETIIQAAMPLFPILKQALIFKSLTGLHAITAPERDAVVKEITLRAKTVDMKNWERLIFSRDMPELMLATQKMLAVTKEQRDYIWSVANNLEANTAWHDRAQLMAILSSFEWVKDKKLNGRYITVPFDAQDLISKTASKTEYYFFENQWCTALISEIIKKLNEGFVPSPDLGSLRTAYNRKTPSAQYNIWLIADYVAILYNRNKL